MSDPRPLTVDFDVVNRVVLFQLMPYVIFRSTMR